jgi:hypothetical protein
MRLRRRVNRNYSLWRGKIIARGSDGRGLKAAIGRSVPVGSGGRESPRQFGKDSGRSSAHGGRLVLSDRVMKELRAFKDHSITGCDIQQLRIELHRDMRSRIQHVYPDIRGHSRRDTDVNKHRCKRRHGLKHNNLFFSCALATTMQLSVASFPATGQNYFFEYLSRSRE